MCADALAGPTLADLLELYRREYFPSKAVTTQRHLRSLYRLLGMDLALLPLVEVTPVRVRAWRDRLLQTRKPGTVREYLDCLSAILSVAVQDLEWLDRNPLSRVRRPPASPARVRCLTREEQAALLAACKASAHANLYPLVLLALSTGARRGELLALRWRDIDLERGYIRIAYSKNRERRAVPLPAIALEALRTRRGPACEGELVFPRKGQRTAFPGDYAWKQARQRAGVVDFRFHDLRHTFASYLALSGARLEDIAEVLGHKSLKVTMRYRHVTLSHTAALVERMAGQFLGP